MPKNFQIHDISTIHHPKFYAQIDIAFIKKTSFQERLNALKPYVACSRIGVPENSLIYTAINIQRKTDTKSMPEKGMQNDCKMRENGTQMGAQIHYKSIKTESTNRCEQEYGKGGNRGRRWSRRGPRKTT